jgi:hypothetical protein
MVTSPGKGPHLDYPESSTHWVTSLHVTSDNGKMPKVQAIDENYFRNMRFGVFTVLLPVFSEKQQKFTATFEVVPTIWPNSVPLDIHQICNDLRISLDFEQNFSAAEISDPVLWKAFTPPEHSGHKMSNCLFHSKATWLGPCVHYT